MRLHSLALLFLTGVSVAQEVPDGLAPSDWSSIRAAYEAGRHKVFAVEGGHQARSPNQQWNVFFDRRGVGVTPDAGDWTWGLDLVSWGFAGSERVVDAPRAVHTEGHRLTYLWNGLDEWYRNGTEGLEHGFTVPLRPEGDGTLTFLLRARGGLSPMVHDNGRNVAFQRDDVTLLEYAGLHVFDADGVTLPARFTVQEHGLLLSIDERGARYPVTIDPIAQQAHLKASNAGQGDVFGWSVAVSGDTVVVGAISEDSNATGVNGNQADNSASSSGAAYVFVRSGATWSQQAYLKASNTGTDDWFGQSVAVSGDTLVVGAHQEDSNAIGVNGSQANNGAFDAGAAYVFVRNGTTWSQQAYLKASNTQAGNAFGWSVAVSGDTVVVGALWEDSDTTGINGSQVNTGAPDAGAAYVFVRTGTTWSQQAYVKASNTGSGDNFGISVGVSGDTIVVGAYGEASNATGVDGNQADDSADEAGAAYVFVRTGTTWSQQAYLKASNAETLDSFGISVAVSGDTAVVGAHYEASNTTVVNGNQTDNSVYGAGAAYVFVRSGVTWSQQAYLKASNADGSDQFGASVALSGETIVVGASQEKSGATGVNGNGGDNSVLNSGAAYVFVRSGTTWSQLHYLKASNTEIYDQFGYAVAVSGDTVVIGVNGEDSGATAGQFDNSVAGAGCVFVFDLRSGSLGSIPAPAQQAYLKASNTDADDVFGGSVAVSGDTVVVGASGESSAATGVNGIQANNSLTGAGAAYVFVRSGTTWTQQAYLKASNTDVADRFGYSVAVSGDTIVVAATGEDSNAVGINGNQANNSAASAGAVYVFVRSGVTWTQQAYLKASNSGAGDSFGWSVATSGDTVVVGAYGEDSNAVGINGNQADNSASSAGAAYVFVRSGTTWSQQAYVKASNTQANDEFGTSVAVASDTLVVGVPREASNATGVGGNQADNSASSSGAVYVFVRSGVTWSQQAYVKASNTAANDEFGASVAAAGETVVVGARGEDSSATGIDGNQADNSAAGAGAAYVFVRNGATWGQQAYVKASNTDAGDGFGRSVAVSGDTIVVSATGEDSSAPGVNGNQAGNGASSAGAAYVFVRCGSAWTQRAYLKASNPNASDTFGAAVAVFGDQVVVGALAEASNATGIDGNQANNAASFAGAAYAFSVARSRPSLWPLSAPQIGQSYTLAIDNLNPLFNLAVLSFGFTQLPWPGVDLGIVQMPCCDLYQSADILIFANPGAGGSTQWTWSPVTGAPGDTFHCQALCLDPSANAFGFSISNAITIKLVP